MRENLRTPEQCKSLFARVSHSDAQNNQKGGRVGGQGANGARRAGERLQTRRGKRFFVI